MKKLNDENNLSVGKVALVGLGRQGKNILRTLVELGHVVIPVLHTKDLEREKWLTENYPSVSYTYDVSSVLKDANVTHVCIATPVETHAEIAKQYLRAGKAVFVEKSPVY